MAQDNEIRLQISAEADESSIARAKRSLDGLEGSVKDVADEIKAASKVGDFKEVEQSAKRADAAVDNLASSTRNLREEIEAAAKVRADQFDAVSNRVGLAGDVESNLRTVGGAIGAAGNQQLGGAIGTVAEIPAVIEAIPRLKEAFVGLPAVIGSAVTALGPVGLAFAAVAAATAVLVSAAQKGAEDMKRAARERLAAENELAQQIASGLTVEAAKEQLAELTRLQQLQTELVVRAENERKAAFEQALNDVGGLDASARVREAFGLTESGEIDAALTERKDLLAQTTAQIEVLNQGLSDGSLQAATMAERERELANERAQAALQAGTLAGALEQARIDGEALNEESLKARIQANKDAVQVAQAELDALRATGDQSQETTARIEALTNQIATLGQVNDVLAKGNSSRAIALEQEREATKKLEDAAKEREKTEQGLTSALNRTSSAASRASSSLSRSGSDIDRARAQERRQRISDTIARVRERQQSEREEATQAAEERGNVLREFYNQEENELIRHQKSLADIRLNAQRQEEDALRSGDIFAIRDIRERAGQQLGDASRDFQFDAGMRARDFSNSNPNMTFNITNADPQAVAYQIQRQLAGTLR